MKKTKVKKINFWGVVRMAGRLMYGLIFAALVIIAGAIAVSTLKIPGNYKLLAVQSGSMEPSIRMGAVVVIKPEEKYNKGDVITVTEPANPRVSLTHRVFEVIEKDGKTSYVTKGDANKTADTEERPKENVSGKVLFSVPYIGYLIGFAKTRDGLIILVVIPATLIIYSELISIKNETVKLLKERKKRKLTTGEKLEVEIGVEEIRAEKGLKKIFGKVAGLFFRKKK